MASIAAMSCESDEQNGSLFELSSSMSQSADAVASQSASHFASSQSASAPASGAQRTIIHVPRKKFFHSAAPSAPASNLQECVMEALAQSGRCMQNDIQSDFEYLLMTIDDVQVFLDDPEDDDDAVEVARLRQLITDTELKIASLRGEFLDFAKEHSSNTQAEESIAFSLFLQGKIDDIQNHFESSLQGPFYKRLLEILHPVELTKEIAELKV